MYVYRLSLLSLRMSAEKEYTNGEITVVWKPDVCQHSTLCWKGLVNVFDPRKRPWVDMQGAETEAIIRQVELCPSGALSWYRTSEGPARAAEGTRLVEVAANGPLLVHGSLTVRDSAGQETQTENVTAFCRCGASQRKPYCDGSHKKINFSG